MSRFLPNIPEHYILERLAKAGGKEMESGKLFSPQSSAALAIDVFGRFIDKPDIMPPLPFLPNINWPAIYVDIEYNARFPWRGGRHPWLDAIVQTKTHLIGVESKRFEPFRDTKTVNLSEAYWRLVWGNNMGPYEKLRDALRNDDVTYQYLDAVQLVKHAFGLRTEGVTRGKGSPVLVYVYIDTPHQSPVKITQARVSAHHAEIADFAARVAGAEVRFSAFSYEGWLAGFRDDLENHAKAVADKYGLDL